VVSDGPIWLGLGLGLCWDPTPNRGGKEEDWRLAGPCSMSNTVDVGFFLDSASGGWGSSFS